jgi:hypothetical protein
MKFRKKRKLKFYSNNEGNEFAIKIDGEEDFKAVSNRSAKYTEVIDDMKIGSGGIFDLSWDQILRRLIGWNSNINEKDYKYLKKFGILHFIDENEKVRIITEKKQGGGWPEAPVFDKVIVTNKRIIILERRQSIWGGPVIWEPYSVLLDEIQSIELAKGFFSCDIIVKTSQTIKINSLFRKSIANDIVNYVNKYIRDKATNSRH